MGQANGEERREWGAIHISGMKAKTGQFREGERKAERYRRTGGRVVKTAAKGEKGRAGDRWMNFVKKRGRAKKNGPGPGWK